MVYLTCQRGGLSKILQKEKKIMAGRAQLKAGTKPIEIPTIRAYATGVKRTASRVIISFRYSEGDVTIIRVEMDPESAAELMKQLKR